MSLRRAGGAIWVVKVTTVLAEGASLAKAPPGTWLVSQRCSPVGGGSSRFIATLKQEDLKARRAALYQQADDTSAASARAAGRSTARPNPVGLAGRKTPAVSEAVFCREAVIR